MEFESNVFGFATPGAHAPPVHREAPRNGDDDLLASGWSTLFVQQGRPPLLDKAVFGLEDQQPPGPFHQHRAQAPVAVLVDGALKAPLAGGVLAGTRCV